MSKNFNEEMHYMVKSSIKEYKDLDFYGGFEFESKTYQILTSDKLKSYPDQDCWDSNRGKYDLSNFDIGATGTDCFCVYEFISNEDAKQEIEGSKKSSLLKSLGIYLDYEVISYFASR